MIRLAVIAIVALGATPAWAGKKALVFPLGTARAGAKLADASPAVTQALADAIGAGIAKVPIEDAAEVLGCDVENTACLERVAGSLGARRLVFGAITREDGTLRLTLTRFDLGPARQQRTFDVSATTADELAAEVVRVAGPMFDLPAAEPRDTPVPVEPAPVAPRITTGTWLLIGGGAALAVSGAVFLLSAQSLRDQVASAPTQTDADFRKLVDLEDQGKLRTYTGDVLLVAGGILATAGVIRAIAQHSAHARVEAAPMRGGAAVMFTMELP